MKTYLPLEGGRGSFIQTYPPTLPEMALTVCRSCDVRWLTTAGPACWLCGLAGVPCEQSDLLTALPIPVGLQAQTA